MGKLLNPRHETFAQFTATGSKRADAYLAAGYRANTPKAAAKRGIALFARAEIRARVAELEKELSESALRRAEVDREWVLNGLKDNYEKSMQTRPVRDRQGKDTGQFKYEPAAANRALELMGKEIGMFADRFLMGSLDQEIEGMDAQQLRAFVRSVAADVGLRMVEMNDDELRDFIERNAPRLGLRVEEVASDPAAGSAPLRTH